MNKLINLLLIFLLLTAAACNSGDSQKPPSSKSQNVDNPFDPANPTNCLATDTDGDGILDCKDPDIDNDGYLNEVDAFQYDPTEWSDTDGDKIGDNTDWNPIDPTEWNDNDDDGIGDNADEDDDNDGVIDQWEVIWLRFDGGNFFDIDLDRIGDNADEDDDNDSVPDMWDANSKNSFIRLDIDNDRTDNVQDSDIDGDGLTNQNDAFQYDLSEWLDTDNDRLGNNIDPDDDNDGFPDTWEEFSTDRTRVYDSDGDSFSNPDDVFPFDPNEWKDTDGDGVGDNGDAFPNNPNETADTDNDGVGNNSDSDADNDGFINCSPIDLNGPSNCNKDKFPLDPTEWIDTDSDDVGDNADEDDDNDSIPDSWDRFSKDVNHFSDFDNDALPDSTFAASPAQIAALPVGSAFFVFDEDADNDGVPNQWDALPYDSSEWFDTDNDNLGNNIDQDKDGDGFPDFLDLFPYDISEWLDNDQDGIGDNLDNDDDNDGAPDYWDDLKFIDNAYSDFDNDGRGDQGNLDIDGDLVTNGVWACTRIQVTPVVVHYDCGFQGYTVPTITADICAYPRYTYRQIGQPRDLFVWDETESRDNDYDCLADNTDEDDDNDGIPDSWDDFPINDVKERVLSWADIDGDGNPNSTYFYNSILGAWEFLFDPDIDGDGKINEGFACTPDTTTPSIIRCRFKTQDTVPDPITPDSELTIFYDAFPFNSNENADYDQDGLGNNQDTDADGDGVVNCIPIDVLSNAVCNQDKLPLVGRFDTYFGDTYALDAFNSVPYCANTDDCYYKNYDRDNDGLTDYEEFILGTNPIASDTDGDGVPDKIEKDEGTNALDPLEFKDDDFDGIANFLDKTPKGAFDESSLRTQIANASLCRTKTTQEVCVDSSTDLCTWTIIPGQFVNDPNYEGLPPIPQIAAGRCDSKPILINDNFSIQNCINVPGEIYLKGRARFSITISPSIISGPACSGLDVTPFRGGVDSSITIENVHIKSESVDRLIESEGKLVKLTNASIDLANRNMPTAVSMTRPSGGTFEMTKSTVIGRLTNAAPNMTLRNLFDLETQFITVKGSISYCDMRTYAINTNNFYCFNSVADTSIFERNTFQLKGTPDDETEVMTDSYAMKHVSIVGITMPGFNYFGSSTKTLKIDGPGASALTASQFRAVGGKVSSINVGLPTETDVGFIYRNGASLQVTAYSDHVLGDFFDPYSDIPILSCSEIPLSDPDTGTVNLSTQIHPAYFDITPSAPTVLNSGTISLFNELSTNITPEGVFDTETQYIPWSNLIIQDQTYFDGGATCTEESPSCASVYIDPSENTKNGIGRIIALPATNIGYQLRFNAVFFSELNQDITLNVKISSPDESVEFADYFVTKRPLLAVDDFSIDTNGVITYYTDFTNSIIIKHKFKPTTSNVMVRIQNMASSNRVYVDNIQLLREIPKTYQFPGINVPFCKIPY